MEVKIKLMRILEEVIPTDRWQLRSARKVGTVNPRYLVQVEDEQYLYEVELELTPVKDKEGEEIRGYRLLSFDFKEKEAPEEKKGKRIRGLKR